ncbi:hypothetical protein [Neorhizobium alkalisoli]|uniref:hypothetical protein n=1 Tax=Neorhizobium alkalisoli TaxID=528178 RepID=UPI000CF96654|nr:hypothetical protein [Neorhizobium alkalisoli]
MANTIRPEFLELSEQDKELKRFFDFVRTVGKLVVTDGADEFVVECRRVTITQEARKRLTEGGPGGS